MFVASAIAARVKPLFSTSGVHASTRRCLGSVSAGPVFFTRTRTGDDPPVGFGSTTRCT
jgi:hypothetical protein